MNPQSHVKSQLSNIEYVRNLLPNNIAVEEFHAIGGQGVVYRGSVGGEIAAVKIYFPGQVQKRIEREVSALGSLDCPNIVGLLWAGEVHLDNGDDLDVVATKLVPGIDLRATIQANQLTSDELCDVAYDIANAISAMWSQRIVHRDLKPSNILIMPSGRACVVDLGLARYLDLSSITPQGQSWGTYGYLSPEQSKLMRQLTCKSDVYALGVIILQAALGHHPTGMDQQLLISSKFHEKLPAEIAQWEFADLLKRMLHPRPTARPTPDQILDILDGCRPA